MTKTFKINGFRNVTSNPVVDTFKGETADFPFLKLDVHQAENGQKFFVLGGPFDVLAWTTDAAAAFRALGDAPVYTTDELRTALRRR